MSKYIEGQAVDPALFSGDDIIIVVEEATGRDTYSTINALRTLLDTLPIVGGTANGVLYLNGSKVVTSGSALTFDGTTFKATATLQLVDPGASRDLLIAASPTGAVHRFYSTNTAAGYSFENSSGSLMTLTALGNLGIGTSSPVGKLDSLGIAYLGSDSNNSLYVESTSTLVTIGAVGRINFSTSALRFLTSDGTAALERMRLDSSGNLGLGVTPNAWVSYTVAQIKDAALMSSGSSEAILSANAFWGSGGWIYRNTAASSRYALDSQHRWFTAPSGTAGNAISFTQAMTLDASGNLGLGTTSISYRVDAVGVFSSVVARLLRSGDYGEVLRFGRNGVTEGASIGYPADGVFAINTGSSGGTERFRIDASGNTVAGASVALATTATNGFLYVPTCAGTPTGVPTAITGMAPIVVNTTNNKLYFYSGGAWRDAGP